MTRPASAHQSSAQSSEDVHWSKDSDSEDDDEGDEDEVRCVRGHHGQPSGEYKHFSYPKMNLS